MSVTFETKSHLAEQRVALFEQRQHALVAQLAGPRAPVWQRLRWRWQRVPELLRPCYLQRGTQRAAQQPLLLVVCALEAHQQAEQAALYTVLHALQNDYYISIMQMGTAPLAMPAFERYYVHQLRDNYTGLHQAALFLQARHQQRHQRHSPSLAPSAPTHSFIYGSAAKNAHWALAQAGLPRLAVLATETEAAASRSALQELVFWAHSGVAAPALAPYMQALFSAEVPRWHYTDVLAAPRSLWRKHLAHACAQHQQQQQQLDLIAASAQFEARFFTPDYTASVPTTVYIERYLRHWHSGIEPRKPCPGFHPALYAAHHALGADEEPFSHYLAHHQPAGPWQQAVVQGLDPDTVLPSAAVALHIHAYYIELLAPLIERIEYNSLRPDLFISVANAQAAAQAQQLTQHYAARVVVRVVPNRGRDIAPFLTEFGAELVAQYDYIGHVHTKQSWHVAEREAVSAWQRFLLDAVLGGADSAGGRMLDACVAQLAQQPDVAIIYPDEPKVIAWDGNADFAQALATQMGLGPLPSAFNFPAGTMFWLQRSYLQSFMRLALQWDDYPPEPVGKDGSVLHALERLFGAAALMQQRPNAVTWATGLSR